MNYLHDRLTKLAIPTILTLDTGEVLDFDATKEDEDEQIELQDKASESSSLLLNKTTKIVKKEVHIFDCTSWFLVSYISFYFM